MDLSSLLLIAPQLLISFFSLMVLRIKKSTKRYTRMKDPLVATGILTAVLLALLAWIMYFDSGNSYSLVMLVSWFFGSCVFAVVWPVGRARRRLRVAEMEQDLSDVLP